MDPLDELLGEEDEHRDARAGPGNREVLARVRPYLARHRGPLLRGLALLLVRVLLLLAAPVLLGLVVDAASGRAAGLAGLVLPAGRGALLAAAGAFVAVVAGGFLLDARLGVLVSRVGVAVVLQLKEDLLRRALSLDPAFFREFPPGRLIARIESDTEAVKDLLSNTGLQLLRAALTLGGIFACMVALHPRAALTVLPVVALLLVGGLLFMRFVKGWFQRSRRALAAITGLLTEQVQGIEVVQMHDYARRARARLDALQAARVQADGAADLATYAFWGLFALCEAATCGAVVWVGAAEVAAGTLTVGAVVVLVEYLRQVFVPLQLLSEFVGQVQRGLVAAGRAFALLARRPTVQDDPDAAGRAVRLEDALVFEDVRFSYDGRAEALRGIRLEVRRGERVALVGPSGGGKSTLVSLLLRFHDPTAGRITVDGVDLRALPRAAWRARVGLVPQEVALFPGTLRDNLTVFDPACPEDALRAACRVAGAERLLDRLGGAGELLERGGNLSQGERQLLSLARALVREPDLLVLDEATASVDPATEARVQLALDRLLAGRTALVIAHRLATVRGCDRVVVIEDGRVVEEGPPGVLWARGGAYRALAGLQLGAEPDRELERAAAAEEAR